MCLDVHLIDLKMLQDKIHIMLLLIAFCYRWKKKSHILPKGLDFWHSDFSTILSIKSWILPQGR